MVDASRLASVADAHHSEELVGAMTGALDERQCDRDPEAQTEEIVADNNRRHPQHHALWQPKSSALSSLE